MKGRPQRAERPRNENRTPSGVRRRRASRNAPRILIVDHREIYAASLGWALAPVARTAKWATRTLQALAILRRKAVDLLVIHPFFEDGDADAGEVIDRARYYLPGLPVVCCSSKPEPGARAVAEALETNGFFNLDLDPADICDAARTAATGGRWFAAVPGRHPDFADEELLVLNLLREGHDLPGIQSGLHGRMGSAEDWLDHLHARLKARGVQDLLRKAGWLGVFGIPPRPQLIEPPAAKY